MRTRIAQIVSVVITALVPFVLFGPAPSAAQETGAKIDAATADKVLPYGWMSQDAYNDVATLNIPGWTRVDGDWKTIFQKNGMGAQIKDAESLGFFAAVYKNSATGEISIAYRGTNNLSDWEANRLAAIGYVPDQYDYAVALATAVKTLYPKASITVTGHSKGGGEATYAAQQTAGIAKVIAFNPASPGIVSSATRQGTEQINVVVPGDLVGDPKGTIIGPIIGLGHLPGKLYKVESTTANQPDPLAQTQGPPENRNKLYYNTATGTHDIIGINGGLCLVSPSSCLSLQTKGTGQQPQTVATASKPVPAPPAAASAPFAQAPPTIGTPPSIVATPPFQYGHSLPPSQAPRTGAAPTSPPVPAARFTWNVPSTTFSPSGSLSAIPPSSHPAPGGISLTKAAAARMPLNIALDGAYYKDGRLVLSGRSDRESGFDAGLFLTGLRAACEPTDPYFSLDPVDVAAWNAEGQSASEDLWRHITRDLNWGTKPTAKPSNTASSLILRTIWARRDYPRLWGEISQSHPNFKAQLVFRPEWLRQTRFGEILYKGDLLLKELSEGVPLLGATELRAGAIPGYVSASARRVTGDLRSVFENGRSENAPPQWHSNRLWFDLASSPVDPLNRATPKAVLAQPPREPNELAKLESVMQGRGLIPLPISTRSLERTITKDGDTLDVSQIYPKMFVRRTKEGKDISGSDPALDELSDDLNRNVEEYVAQYRELQTLNELFRSYILAVQITNENDVLCDRLEALPLLDAEKVPEPLPEFHPSELFLTFGMYEFSVPKGRKLLSASTRSASGGVSISGKSFSSTQLAVGGTLVTQRLNREISQHPDEGNWTADDRLFISFNVETDLPVAEPAIENEPPAATLPTSPIGLDKIWVAVFLLIVVALAVGKRRRRT